MWLFKKKEEPHQFYTTCLKEFHDVGEKRGLTPKGVIFIPELLEYGQKASLWYLKNKQLQERFPNPEVYYHLGVLTLTSFGIFCGHTWDIDFDLMQDPRFVEAMMRGNPTNIAEDVIKNELGLSHQKYDDFCSEIFDLWLKNMDPYCKMRDPGQYVFNATLAAFQLGVSMILSAKGY